MSSELGKRSELIQRYAEQTTALSGQADLIERVQARLMTSPNERCAIPRDPLIDAHFSVDPQSLGKINLLAADGSQILPNRHDEVSFGLINSAVFYLQTQSGEAPQIITESQLMDGSAAANAQLPDDLTTDEQVALLRDVAERELLSREACAIANGDPVIALTDGPLELYFLRNPQVGRLDLVKEYLRTFQQIADHGVIAAGYIDRPRSDYVLRMLELLRGTPKDAHKPFVSDSGLFNQLIPPGERSATFRLNSNSVREMEPQLQLSFFYLNTGSPRNPNITRVEIPEWVAADERAVNLLHACLINQCRLLSANPYPYALHRAHESAVVAFREKDRIKELLMQELQRRNVKIQTKSGKQRAKDLAGVRYDDFPV